MKELLTEFFTVTRGRRPEHLIFFRDGVSEGQFKEVGCALPGGFLSQNVVVAAQDEQPRSPLLRCECAPWCVCPQVYYSEYSAVREACKEMGDPSAECERLGVG
jgi:hypothetical protein